MEPKIFINEKFYEILLEIVLWKLASLRMLAVLYVLEGTVHLEIGNITYKTLPVYK